MPEMGGGGWVGFNVQGANVGGCGCFRMAPKGKLWPRLGLSTIFLNWMPNVCCRGSRDSGVSKTDARNTR